MKIERIGDCVLYLGDCLEVLPTLKAGSVDAVVTSPPYDDLREYRGNYKFDFAGVSAALWSVVAEGGVVVWVVGDQTKSGSESGTSFRQAIGFMDVGFNLHDTMIYEKAGVAFPDTNRYYQIFEFMFVCSKGKPKTSNLLRDRKNICAGRKVSGTSRQTDGSTKSKACIGNITPEYGVRYNIWRIPHEDKTRSLHPATFPESLPSDHILTWTNKGDVVADCFMGSGTTGVACVNTGRKFIGIERDEKYFAIACDRIQKAYAARPALLEAV